ncbi:hypothetical protein ACFY36_29720 [Actinoplanes sp. NPDC000266]
MRVTGTFWAAVILHGLTDPTTFLSTGGIDQTVGTEGATGWSLLASFATIAFVIFAVIAAFFIRGRVVADEVTASGPHHTKHRAS